MVLYAGGAAVAVALVTAGVLTFGRARVTGQTPTERVASVCRLADEQPLGAAGAIANTAKEPDPNVRRAAMLALGRFVRAGHRPVVAEGTVDPSPRVRSAAAATLGLYRDDAGADRLGEMALSDSAPTVRAAAVDALEVHGSARAGEVLMGVVHGCESTWLRDRALAAVIELMSHHWPKGDRPWRPARWNALRVELARLTVAARGSPIVAHDGKTYSLISGEEIKK